MNCIPSRVGSQFASLTWWHLLVKNLAAMLSLRLSLLFCIGASLILTACPTDSGMETDAQPTSGSAQVEPVVSGLANPLYLTAPMSDSRLFIVEQPGRIRIVESGTLLSNPFLDLTSGQISSGGERGLLGLAFHPSYASNGSFYVYFTAPNGDITIERFTVSANPNVADAGSGHVILTIPHSSESNHNGGMIAFGTDGKLYLGTGDGGAEATRTETVRGKIRCWASCFASTSMPQIPTRSPRIIRSLGWPERGEKSGRSGCAILGDGRSIRMRASCT